MQTRIAGIPGARYSFGHFGCWISIIGCLILLGLASFASGQAADQPRPEVWSTYGTVEAIAIGDATGQRLTYQQSLVSHDGIPPDDWDLIDLGIVQQRGEGTLGNERHDEASPFLSPSNAIRSASRSADPEGITFLLPGGIPLIVRHIPAGTFTMGTPDASEFSNEGPATTVTLTHDYYLGQYPVTQGQWEAIMGPMEVSRPPGYWPFDQTDWNGDPIILPVGDDHPMFMINFQEAQEFISRLNDHLIATGQGDGGHFRLPTEAEWERAARGGTQTRYYWGDTTSGFFEPNQYGLHAILTGHVREWCQNYWESRHPGGDVADPSGPSFGTGGVMKGTSHAAFRRRGHDDHRGRNYGFRVLYDKTSPPSTNSRRDLAYACQTESCGKVKWIIGVPGGSDDLGARIVLGLSRPIASAGDLEQALILVQGTIPIKYHVKLSLDGRLARIFLEGITEDHASIDLLIFGDQLFGPNGEPFKLGRPPLGYNILEYSFNPRWLSGSGHREAFSCHSSAVDLLHQIMNCDDVVLVGDSAYGCGQAIHDAPVLLQELCGLDWLVEHQSLSRSESQSCGFTIRDSTYPFETLVLTRDYFCTTPSSAFRFLEISELLFDCNGYGIISVNPETNGAGISIQRVSDIVIRNCSVAEFRHGIGLSGAFDNHIESNALIGNQIGIQLGGNSGTASRNLFIGNEIRDGETGVYLQTINTIRNIFSLNSIEAWGRVSGVSFGGGADSFNLGPYGNYWSDWEENEGYPDTYLFANLPHQIDHHPLECMYDRHCSSSIDEEPDGGWVITRGCRGFECTDLLAHPVYSANGNFLVEWPAVDDAEFYELERAQEGTAEWTPVYAGEDLYYVENIQPGLFRYRLRSCSPVGCGPWSESAIPVEVGSGPGGMGDINGDGIVNVADVTHLANLLAAGNAPPVAIGDINGDGVVDWADVQALAEMIVE